MKNLHLKIQIDAPVNKVWDAVVVPEKFNEWAALFHEGTYFVGGWKQGDDIRFVSIDEAGKEIGMFSKVEISEYPHHIKLKNLGFIIEGVKDTDSELAKEWTPAVEEYTLIETDEAKTLFEVNVEIPEKNIEDFKKDWDNALLKLKEISER